MSLMSRPYFIFLVLLLFAAASFGAGCGLMYLFAGSGHTQDLVEREREACVPSDEQLVQHVGGPEGQALGTEQRIVLLQQQVEVLNSLLRMMGEELEGTPTTWGPDGSPEANEAGYGEAMDEIISDCFPEWRLAEMDCTEPPCVAAIWRNEPKENPLAAAFRDVSGCDAWTRRYGSSTTRYSNSVECHGKRRSLLLLSPPPEKYWDVKIGLDIEEVLQDPYGLIEKMNEMDEVAGDDEGLENRMVRLKYRWKMIEDRVACPAE